MGEVPSRGRMRGNHTLMFLSLFLPPFPSLKIKTNKKYFLIQELVKESAKKEREVNIRTERNGVISVG